MKKSTLITLIGILVAGATFAQESATRKLSSFSKVSAQEGIDVFVKAGDKEEAKIVSDSHDLDEVLTDVNGSTLKIHLEGNNHRNVDVKVYVTYKKLRAISASSAGSIKSQGTIQATGDFDVAVSSAGDIEASIEGVDELDIDASSAGDVKLEVAAESIDAEVSSAGDIEVKGMVNTQEVSASSSGDYDGYDLESTKVEARVSSAGSIRVNVSEKIDASASSGGSVRYKGSPKYVDVSSSSGGSVKRS